MVSTMFAAVATTALLSSIAQLWPTAIEAFFASIVEGGVNGRSIRASKAQPYQIIHAAVHRVFSIEVGCS